MQIFIPQKALHNLERGRFFSFSLSFLLILPPKKKHTKKSRKYGKQTDADLFKERKNISHPNREKMDTLHSQQTMPFFLTNITPKIARQTLVLPHLSILSQFILFLFEFSSFFNINTDAFSISCLHNG